MHVLIPPRKIRKLQINQKPAPTKKHLCYGAARAYSPAPVFVLIFFECQDFILSERPLESTVYIPPCFPPPCFLLLLIIAWDGIRGGNNGYGLLLNSCLIQFVQVIPFDDVYQVKRVFRISSITGASERPCPQSAVIHYNCKFYGDNTPWYETPFFYYRQRWCLNPLPVDHEVDPFRCFRRKGPAYYKNQNVSLR